MAVVVFDHAVLNDGRRIPPNTPFEVTDADWYVSRGATVVSSADAPAEPPKTTKRTRKKS